MAPAPASRSSAPDGAPWSWLASAEPSRRARLLWLLGVPAPAALVLGRVPQRTDYLGHFLAGYGATLLVVWAVARVLRGRPEAALGATLAAVGLGALVEATVFALAGFSWIDFGAQSLGAALAGLALVQGATGDPELDTADGVTLFGASAHGRDVLLVAAGTIVAGFGFAFA